MFLKGECLKCIKANETVCDSILLVIFMFELMFELILRNISLGQKLFLQKKNKKKKTGICLWSYWVLSFKPKSSELENPMDYQKIETELENLGECLSKKNCS